MFSLTLLPSLSTFHIYSPSIPPSPVFGALMLTVFFKVLISKEYLQLEPIGLVFVFFFALILVIQFTAMLFHRFGTLSHILASTELVWFCSKKVSNSQVRPLPYPGTKLNS